MAEKESADREELEDAHRAIVELYDMADKLMVTLEDARATHQDTQIEMIEPLVEEVISAADELSQQFCDYVDADDKAEAKENFNLKPIFMRVFKAVDSCLGKINLAPAEVAENVTTVVMPALEGLMSHAEKLFGKLSAIIEKSRNKAQQKDDFQKMIVRESYLARLFGKNKDRT